MDVSEKMKYKLANAMKELLVHTPVDKIDYSETDRRSVRCNSSNLLPAF